VNVGLTAQIAESAIATDLSGGGIRCGAGSSVDAAKAASKLAKRPAYSSIALSVSSTKVN
jgi:hypothetical protein